MSVMKLLGAILLTALGTVTMSALAAEKQQVAPSSPSPFAEIREKADRTVAPAASAPQLSSELAEADLKSYAQYLKWQRTFAIDSWEWHLLSTRILMAVVLAIVACGLWFTYLQFTKELKPAALVPPAPPPPPPAGQADPVNLPPGQPGNGGGSTFKAGPAGIEITSQVVGLLVLAFSLAFFYLYVKEVYPMQEGELRKQAEAADTSATPQKK